MSTVAELYKGVATADNELLFTTKNVQQYGSFTLLSTVGAVDVEVTLNGSDWSTAALALEDAGATANGTYVVVTTANRVAKFRGKFTQIRVRQAGATGATASLLCGNE
jgi:hypothetical protein